MNSVDTVKFLKISACLSLGLLVCSFESHPKCFCIHGIWFDLKSLFLRGGTFFSLLLVFSFMFSHKNFNSVLLPSLVGGGNTTHSTEMLEIIVTFFVSLTSPNNLKQLYSGISIFFIFIKWHMKKKYLELGEIMSSIIVTLSCGSFPSPDGLLLLLPSSPSHQETPD